jgi:hypothetical protein
MGASLRMLERDLKVAQKTDCISRPSGNIRMEDNQTPPATRIAGTAEGAEPFETTEVRNL